MVEASLEALRVRTITQTLVVQAFHQTYWHSTFLACLWNCLSFPSRGFGRITTLKFADPYSEYWIKKSLLLVSPFFIHTSRQKRE